jgi:hypothetical protein
VFFGNSCVVCPQFSRSTTNTAELCWPVRPAAAADVCGLLLRAAAGLTLVSVVHNPQLLPLLAERVIGQRHGRCVFDLPLAAVDAATLAALYHPGEASTVLTEQTVHATPACIASWRCAT